MSSGLPDLSDFRTKKTLPDVPTYRAYGLKKRYDRRRKDKSSI